LALSLVLGFVPAQGHEIAAGELVIEHPWARATVAAQKNGAAYMTLRNRGSEPERLLAVRTDEARSAELHGSTITAEGVMQMRAAGPLDIPPEGEAKLAPSGVHIMLVGLKGPLFEGVTFPMTLVFERAGEVNVEVEVMGARANETIVHDEAHAPHAGTEHGGHGAGHQP
jgi:hypothetical protein